jgi:hypothetical protein
MACQDCSDTLKAMQTYLREVPWWRDKWKQVKRRTDVD